MKLKLLLTRYWAVLVREKKIAAALFLLFLLSITVRLLYFPSSWFFGYEQGRDALVAQGILLGQDYKLVGPKTDIDAIYHGGGFYYFLSLLYFIGHGDPVWVEVLAIIWQSSLVFILYAAGYLVTRDKKLAIVAPFLFAVCFDAVVSARWLSNATLGLPFVGLFFLFLILFVERRSAKYWMVLLPLATIGYHFQILHIFYAYFVLFLVMCIYRLWPDKKYFSIGAICSLFLLLPLFAFEYKSRFAQTRAVWEYINGDGRSHNIFSSLWAFGSGWLHVLQDSIFPYSSVVSVVLLVSLGIVYWRRATHRRGRKIIYLLLILSVWPIVHTIMYNKTGLMQMFVGTSLGMILLITYLVNEVYKAGYKKILVIPLIIVLGSLFGTVGLLTVHQRIFYHTYEYGIGYPDKLAVVAALYDHADTPFYIDAFNVPYGQHEAWEYLLQFYGRRLSKEKAQLYQPGSHKRLFAIHAKNIDHGHFRLWRLDTDKNSTLLRSDEVGPYVIEERVPILGQ